MNKLTRLGLPKQLFGFCHNRKFRGFICLFLLAVITIYAYVWVMDLWDNDAEQEDIYYIWLEGKRILEGDNPYERILAGNMRDNDKYATYFPLFYLLSAGMQFIGFRDFSDWLEVWRVIFLIFNLAIAALIFQQIHRHQGLVLALFAALFWLFNRWTLHVTYIAQIEFITIFFLLLSLVILPKHKYTACILFSVSLAIKQIAVFLLPLYLIWIWQLSDRYKLRQTLTALLIIVSIPVITSIPFLLWHSEGYIKSILFSATRESSTHFGVQSLDALIDNEFTEFVGIRAKIPMLFLIFLIYISSFNIGVYTGVFLVMLTFIDFNSVIFRQYICWTIPFALLLVCDYKIRDLISHKLRKI